jgi:glyceraldehyde-3-phosphate dehydrogenase/erythrose-4-phosphate dehydrogenase
VTNSSTRFPGCGREHYSSSSGAARALSLIWKGLNITGKAYGVTARTGSIAEPNLLTERHVTVDPRLVLGATSCRLRFFQSFRCHTC